MNRCKPLYELKEIIADLTALKTDDPEGWTCGNDIRLKKYTKEYQMRLARGERSARPVRVDTTLFKTTPLKVDTVTLGATTVGAYLKSLEITPVEDDEYLDDSSFGVVEDSGD